MSQDRIETFKDKWKSMREIWRIPHPQFVRYVDETWLGWKEKFVTCFHRNKQHNGHVTTSRVESAYAALKRWIGSSTGDLLSVNNAIKLACDGQLARIKQQHAKERATFGMRFGSIYTDVMGKISEAGLRAAFREYKNDFILMSMTMGSSLLVKVRLIDFAL